MIEYYEELNAWILEFCRSALKTQPVQMYSSSPARKVINQSWPLVGLQNNEGFSSDILVVRWFLQANATKRGQPLGTHFFFRSSVAECNASLNLPPAQKRSALPPMISWKVMGAPWKKPCGASINAIAKRLENSVSSMVYEGYNYSNHGVPTSYHWMIYPIPVAKDFRWKSNIPLETGHV